MADTGSAPPANEGDKAEKKNQNPAAPKPKKEKTPAQIERERVRRRRRRQRKRMMQGLSGEVKGVLPSNGQQKPSEPALEPQQKRPEETHPRPVAGRDEGGKPREAEKTVEIIQKPPPTVQPAEAEQLLPPLEAEEEPSALVEAEKPPAVEVTPEQVVPELPPDETIAEINEEQVNPPYEDFTGISHVFEQPSLEEEPEAEENPEEITFQTKPQENIPPESVEEMPRKFEKESPQEKKEKMPPPEEENLEKNDLLSGEKLEKEELGEKKSFAQVTGLQFGGLIKKLSAALGKFFKKFPAFIAPAATFFKPKFLIAIILLGGLGYLAYFAYSSKFYETIIGSVTDFFTPKTPPKIEVAVNENDLRDFGIASALLFGNNSGSAQDLVPMEIRVATFFGELKEPAVEGETGISAATFYGELKDQAQDINEFVQYMKNLEKVQSLYEVDVYEMLDRTTRRDAALLQYLDNLRKVRDESLRIQQKIGTNVDDLKVSLESLNPDRAQYESDFFVAMEALQAEKSDLLLKGFVDISQKQDALRARINALNKLATYYATALSRLDKRIEAVDKNKEALIQGIRVVDVPGGGLNIIIKP